MQRDGKRETKTQFHPESLHFYLPLLLAQFHTFIHIAARIVFVVDLYCITSMTNSGWA